jgi:hypothetical protein
VYSVCEIDRFIRAEGVQQAFVHVDEFGPIFDRSNARQTFRLAILIPQVRQELDAAGMRIV